MSAAEADEPRPARVLQVRVLSDDDLRPFEEQTLAVSNESLTLSKQSLELTKQTIDISRRAYYAAIIAAGIAIIGAALVYLQVREMDAQTQILSAQAISAAAGASLQEMNTREQFKIWREANQISQSNQLAVLSVVSVGKSSIPNVVEITLFHSGGIAAASNVRHGLAWGVFPLPLAQRDVFGDPPFDPETTTMESPETREIYTKPIIPTPAQRVAIDASKSVVVVWGTVKYETMNHARVNRFCYVMSKDLTNDIARCAHNRAEE